MKKLIMLLSILAAFSAHAKSADCRIEAQVGAIEHFKANNSERNFFVRKPAKMNPVKEDKVIHHFVEIGDRENTSYIMQTLTVTVDAQTCNILDVN